MASHDHQMMLQTDRWYGWQMIPGYGARYNVPYFSPVLVTDIKPLKTGTGRLRVEFFNAFYAPGAQGFTVDFEILKHAAGYMVVNLDGAPERCAIISEVEFAWIERCCPALWFDRPPHSMSGAAQGSADLYLHEVFGTKKWP